MLTIKEIAELAGVSKSTVSRVLNNNGYIGEETRQRIEKVIKEQNYTPSAAAVSLSKQETNTIGVIIPEIDNAFFGEIIKGITEIADQQDFSIICCDTQNKAEKELRALKMLEQQRVRGILFTPARGDGDLAYVKELKKQLQGVGVPIVVVDRDFQYSVWDTVYYENYQSGYLATRTLIEAGVTRIGFLQGDMKLKIAKDRYQGFLDAMAEDEKKVIPEDILEGDFTIDTAYRLCRERFAKGDIPEGIVTANNRSSLGFMKAAGEAGLKIGKDIAVVGIDHIPLVDIFGMNFSYVCRDTVEMGRVAMKLLIERMKNPKHSRQISMIPCELKLNGSEKIREL